MRNRDDDAILLSLTVILFLFLNILINDSINLMPTMVNAYT